MGRESMVSEVVYEEESLGRESMVSERLSLSASSLFLLSVLTLKDAIERRLSQILMFLRRDFSS